MPTPVSDQVRNILFHSLSAVESHKAAIVDAMATGLAAEPEDRSPSHAKKVAMLLVDMLIEQVKHLVEARYPQNLDIHLAEHRLHAIDGRHYSLFENALIPILKDTMGNGFSRAVGSAWCEAFRAVIRRMQIQDEPVSAQRQQASPERRWPPSRTRRLRRTASARA